MPITTRVGPKFVSSRRLPQTTEDRNLPSVRRDATNRTLTERASPERLKGASGGAVARVANSAKRESSKTDPDKSVIPALETLPYTPGRTKVIFSKSQNERSEKGSLEILYKPESVPDPEETPREKIQIEGVSKEKIDQAIKIAKEIKKSWLASDRATGHTRIETFMTVAEEAYKRLSHDRKGKRLSDDQELLTMVVYYSVKNDLNNKNGLFSRTLIGFLDCENPNFVQRVRTLGKYFIVNVQKLNTAEKIEKFDEWVEKLREAGLSSLLIFSTPEFLKVTLPGYLDGENSPIREWCICTSDRWSKVTDAEGLAKRKFLAQKVCQWILKYRLKVVNANGTINKQALEKAIEDGKLGEAFYDKKKENNSGGMMEVYEGTQNLIQAVELAAPGAVGIGENQVPPWKFKHKNMWVGFNVLDQLTEYLVTRDCTKKGKVKADKIKAIKTWTDKYGNKASHALTNYSPCEALLHKYPHLFGWEKDQIKPWEMEHVITYNNIPVELRDLRFRHQLAYGLYLEDIAKLHLDEDEPRITFDMEKFAKWIDEGNTLCSLCRKYNLTSGYRHAAGGQLANAYNILFDRKGKQTLKEPFTSGSFQKQLGDDYVFSLTLSEKALGIDREKLGLIEVKKEVTETAVEGTKKNAEVEPDKAVLMEIEAEAGEDTEQTTASTISDQIIALVKKQDIEQALLVEVQEPFANNSPAPCRLKGPVSKFFDDKSFAPIAYKMAYVLAASGDAEGKKSFYLEHILNSKIITDDDLRTLLGTLKSSVNVFYNLNIDKDIELADGMKALINGLLATEGGPGKTLLAALEKNKNLKFPEQATTIDLLDYAFGYFAGVASMYAASEKLSGKPIVLEEVKIKLPKINRNNEKCATLIAKQIKVDWEAANKCLARNRDAGKSSDDLREKAEGLESGAEIKKLIDKGALDEKYRNQALQTAKVLSEQLLRAASSMDVDETLIELESTETNYDLFNATVKYTAEKLDVPEAVGDIDPGLETLIALHLLKPEGFLTQLPEELVYPFSHEFIPVISTLMSYAMAA